MATGNEPALTPAETARQASRAVIDVGAGFGHEVSFAQAGRRLGLGPWAFYFGARAGVLGPVDADVVTAVCGFFAPGFVRPAWQAALAGAAPGVLVSEDARLCVIWARRHLDGLPGIERLADLAGRVVGAADATSRALFAAWRAWPDPGGDPAARAGLALLRLREHRGGGHLLAVSAEGLTPASRRSWPVPARPRRRPMGGIRRTRRSPGRTRSAWTPRPAHRRARRDGLRVPGHRRTHGTSEPAPGRPPARSQIGLATP